jgi:hypothetical protein
MKDHAQAKIDLIHAALKAAEINVKAGKPLETHELATFSLFRIAARNYKETKEPSPPDRGDDEDWMDRHHGVG